MWLPTRGVSIETGYVTAVGLGASTYYPNVFLILSHYPSCSFTADTDPLLKM